MADQLLYWLCWLFLVLPSWAIFLLPALALSGLLIATFLGGYNLGRLRATLAILLLAIGYSHAETLTFDPSPTPNVTYRLKWGTNAAQILATRDLGTNRVTALTNGPWGRHYFTVTALSTNGIESLPSNELVATNRPAGPLQLRIIEGVNVVYLDASHNGGQAWQRVATVTNDPALLTMQRAALFRAAATNLPPAPGSGAASPPLPR